jgi:hypothetical protein
VALTGSDKAYLQARAGIGRSGAIRSNYATWQLVVVLTRRNDLGELEEVDLAPYIAHDSLTVQRRLNDEIDTASWSLIPSVPWRPRAGEPIQIANAGGMYLFGGLIIRVQSRWVPGIETPWYDIECVDHLARLDMRLVTTEYTGQSATVILRDVLATFTSWPTAAVSIPADLPLISVAFTNERPSAVFRAVTAMIGGGFMIEPTGLLKAWGQAGPVGQLTPPAPLSWGLSSLKQFAYTEDATQVRTRVIVEGRRTASKLGIPRVNWTQLVALPLDDASMFRAPVAPAITDHVRLGTQLAEYYFVPALPLDPAKNPAGSTLTQDAAPGATKIFVASLTPFQGAQFGWVEVGNQFLFYWGWTVGEKSLSIGRPPTIDAVLWPADYGAIAAPLTTGDTVTRVPFLHDLRARPDGRWFHPQAEGTSVVMRVVREAGIPQWAARTGTDGIVEHIVQDDRLSYAAAEARAVAELNDFWAPLYEFSWETDDMNADLGRVQVIADAFMPDNLVDVSVMIQEVTIRFPAGPTRPPRRQCRGAQARTANLLSVLVTNPR